MRVCGRQRPENSRFLPPVREVGLVDIDNLTPEEKRSKILAQWEWDHSPVEPPPDSPEKK
jgi:hypothetical protein